MKRILLTLIALLMAAATISWAESTDCNNPDHVVPDGRPTYENSWFSANTNYYWAFEGQQGHSYSVEFLYDFDNDDGPDGGYADGQAYNVGDDFCSGNTTLLTTYTGGTSPVLTFPSIRYSFIAAKSGDFGLWLLEGPNAGRFSFRVVDTTLFNPRWSTYSGFTTQWGLNNNSDHDISGTLTIYDSSGRLLKTVNVKIPSGTAKFLSSAPSDLNLPPNKVGTAMFAHVGPPGAIQADAYMLNSSGSVIIPAKFEPRNAQW